MADRSLDIKEITEVEMKKLNILKRRALMAASLYVLVMVLIVAVGFNQSVFAAEVEPIVQKTFKSPEEAAKGLTEALRSHDTKELLAIFGPAGKEVIASGDVVGDKAGRERFVKAYEEMSKLEKEADNKATLVVGKNE